MQTNQQKITKQPDLTTSSAGIGWTLLALLIVLLMGSCTPAPDQLEGQGLIVLEGVTVIDGTDAPPLVDATVVINGDTIAAIGKKGDFSYPEDAIFMNVQGRFLMPGFIDAHTHVLEPAVSTGGQIPPRPWSAGSEKAMKTYLEYGITTIRNAGAPDSTTAVAVALRDAVAGGLVPGPRIFTAGIMIDDPGSIDKGAAHVATEAEIREVVRSQAEAGVDYVKLYFFLSPDLVQAAIDEARLQGIMVSAHLGRTSWTDAANAGIDAIHHMCPQSAELLPEDRRAEFLAEAPGTQVVFRWFDYVDLDSPEINELLDALVENGVSIDPTLVVWESWFWADQPDTPEHPVSDYVAAEAIDISLKYFLGNWSDEDFDRAKAAWPTALKFIKLLHERGVRILAGTDLPPGKPFHRELELLVSAGIPPQEVLSIATRNAAQELGIIDEVGTIEVGKKADIVILRANPLKEISNTREIEVVIQAGKVLARSD